MAKYQCEMQQLRAKDPNDEKAQKRLTELQKELEDYSEEMKIKHKDKENDTVWSAKGDKIMEEEMKKCN